MFSETRTALEQFDNQHDFERMAADILNALGYSQVVPIAPRGGSDQGKDITFTTESGGNGLACVTLRDDIQRKFEEDFSQRSAGEYDKYILFCTAYLPSKKKLDFITYCAINLKAELVLYDIEALRSLLDSTLPETKERYLYPKRADEKQLTLLQQYLDQISKLLHEGLFESKHADTVRNFARTHTLVMLPRLDAIHKGRLLQFLSETGLINIIDLSGADLRGAQLLEVKLMGAILCKANLSKAILRLADLHGANLKRANLYEAELIDANLSGANLSQANLGHANLHQARLINADLSQADLHQANLTHSFLLGSNLLKADLYMANLTKANLDGANLVAVCLTEAKLTEARLNKVDLSESELWDCDLSWARLREAILQNTDLSGSNLSGADLSKADLTGAKLSGTNLSKASLYKATMCSADLCEANLDQTNLEEAALDGAIFTLEQRDEMLSNWSKALNDIFKTSFSRDQESKWLLE